MAKLAKHHIINGSVAMAVALIVSIASWTVVEGNIESIAAGTSRTACFEAKTGHVYLRTICKKTETKLVINSAGANGAQGLQGQSAFDLATANGFTGTVTEWLASLVGPQGAPGPQGPGGSNGSDGARGATGSTGPQGPIGPAGPAGTNGTNGIDGTNGTNGFVPDYGYFIDVTTQTMSAINTPTAMKFGTNIIADKGVTIVNGNEIHFAKAGTYNISFSAQIFKASSNSPEDIDIWLRTNGSDVANSNTQMTIVNDVAKTGKAVAAWNFFVTTSAANEYAQLMWSAANTIVSIPYVGPQTVPTRPGIPSLILSVNQVG